MFSMQEGEDSSSSEMEPGDLDLERNGIDCPVNGCDTVLSRRDAALRHLRTVHKLSTKDPLLDLVRGAKPLQRCVGCGKPQGNRSRHEKKCKQALRYFAQHGRRTRCRGTSLLAKEGSVTGANVEGQKTLEGKLERIRDAEDLVAAYAHRLEWQKDMATLTRKNYIASIR